MTANPKINVGTTSSTFSESFEDGKTVATSSLQWNAPHERGDPFFSVPSMTDRLSDTADLFAEMRATEN